MQQTPLQDEGVQEANVSNKTRSSGKVIQEQKADLKLLSACSSRHIYNCLECQCMQAVRRQQLWAVPASRLPEAVWHANACSYSQHA